ncbi:SusC/RagA family TonB-linked outer membrane protein [Fulvitalea axinellae]|uniref:SusC/RagA family TonB-linked outer membrane protein n=1 Tax=Fulvitalea axinellae TaxID=1182444 RepID=A0AAU9CVM4_9BACT|nr:SusC/RagA family TonB-linked outer membrane protein [Fulvitalea axinellae]
MEKLLPNQRKVPAGAFGGLLLPIFFLMTLFVSVSTAQAEDKRITFEAKGVLLSEILDFVRENTDYEVFYREDQVNEYRRISVSVRNKDVNVLLRKALRGSGLTYEITGNQIVVLPKKPTPAPEPAQAQGFLLSGRVIDAANGEGLPGATVQVLGKTGGMITDVEGNFSMKVNLGNKLQVSFIGYQTQTVTVTSKNKLLVSMDEQTDELETVTVVAFAEQEKKSVVASVTTIKPEELRVPSSNLTTALTGQVPGVLAFQRTGEPGEDNAQFFVRGVTTFGESSNPLILIDGIELGTEDLAGLHPDDIASFSIMKDAAATALYGARGANGVILVNTKQGVEGKIKVSMRFDNIISMPTKDIDLADPITYMKLHNEAVKTRDPLGELPYTQDKIVNTERGMNQYVYPQNDWYNDLFKRYAFNQRANLNIRGGGKIAQYYVSGSFSKDNGVLKVDNRNNFNNNIDLKKYSLRSNIDIKLTQTTKAKIMLSSRIEDYVGPLDGGSDLYRKVMRSNPVLFPAVYAPDEANEFTPYPLFGNFEDGSYINPYAEMVKGYKEKSSSTIATQFQLDQDLGFITEGLRANALVNLTRKSYFDVSRFYKPFYHTVDSYDRDQDKYTLHTINPDGANGGTDFLDYQEGDKKVQSTIYFQGILNYKKDLGGDHTLASQLIYIMRSHSFANAGTLQTSLPSRNMGLSGRFNYYFKDRYFTEFNFGYNGSERFHESERFGFFPSAGLGWMVSEEPFFESLSNTVSKLKIGLTYGLTGNDNIGSSSDRFFYLSEVKLNNGARSARFGTNFDEVKEGSSILRYADPSITWETAYKTNFSVELDMWNSWETRLDVFHEKRTNILIDRTNISAAAGFQAPIRANVGEAQSQGFEISSRYARSLGKDLFLAFKGSLTYATSEILKYDEPDYSDTPWRSREGRPINQTWGYVAERLFVDDEEIRNSPEQTFGPYSAGDIKYKDIDGDGKITTADKVPIGTPTAPEITYDFGASLSYKNWDVNFFFKGYGNTAFWINPGAMAPFVDNDGKGGVTSNNALMQVIADNHWSEENRNLYALWPRLAADLGDWGNNTQTSTWYMREGDMLRLKSLELGYTFDKNLTSRWGIDKFRIYFTGNNLLAFSKFKLWDPEMAGNGLAYPIQRSFNLGVHVTL